MKPVSQWTEADLQFLIDNKMSETLDREYKEKLSVSTDGERKEPCKDVSSFANGQGGVIIFGLRANKEPRKGSIPVGLTPIADMGLKEVAQQILLDGVKPRMEFRFYSVQSSDGKGEYVLIEIPKSLRGLHMVTLKGENRYYIRRDFESVPMTPFEIEEAYRNYALWEKDTEAKLEQYRLENPNSPAGQLVVNGGWVSFTIVPVFPAVDLFAPLCFEWPRDLPAKLRGLHTHDGLYGASFFVPNFHGMLATSDGEELISYRHQVFRSGAMCFGATLNEFVYDDKINRIRLACEFHDKLSLAAGLYEAVGYVSKVKFRFEIEGVLGLRLDFGGRRAASTANSSVQTFSHSEVCTVEDLIESPAKKLQPVNHHLWQTFGLGICDLYVDEQEGVYLPEFLRSCGLTQTAM